MKKKESPPTLSKRLRDAIYKDMQGAYDEACYETFDYYGTLNCLQELGVSAMPNTEKVIEEIERMENDSFSRLHEIWGMEKPFGLSNLS